MTREIGSFTFMYDSSILLTMLLFGISNCCFDDFSEVNRVAMAGSLPVLESEFARVVMGCSRKVLNSSWFSILI